MQTHKTVSRDEWIAARRDLLAKEKAQLKAHDELARQRDALLAHFDVALDTPLEVQTAGVPGQDRLAALHLSMSDGTGDSAIVEFIGGTQVIHHSRDYQVMTNSPTFEKQLAIEEYWKEIGGTVMLPGTRRSWCSASPIPCSSPPRSPSRRGSHTCCSWWRCCGPTPCARSRGSRAGSRSAYGWACWCSAAAS